MNQLRISLLGRLTATCDDAPLDLGGPRQRAVLAVLLLARGEVVPAGLLVDALWGERASESAVAALQSYVSHLRRSLQPGAPARERSGIIVREGPGYAVRIPAESVDAWRFEALLALAEQAIDPTETARSLREALDLWTGPALAEYADEPWAEADIARLSELRLLARERLLAARLETDEPGLLVPELEAMVADDPLREERWRLLVLALYRAQRQADALAALRRARTVLADELGVDPGPALRDLEAAVLAQHPSLLAPPRPAGPATRPDPRPARPSRDLGVLVERDGEVAALADALDDVVDGRPGLVLVEGAPGIGKTRLLQEAGRLAADRGVHVLSARSTQLETAFAFGVVRQLLEPELVDHARRDDVFLGTAGAARGVFDLEDGPADGLAVLHGLYRIVVTLATEGPLLVLVDDAQWCDAASLRFLAYLARRLDGLGVLLVLALRTGTDELRQAAPLVELALEPDVRVLRPEALTAPATAALVAGRLEATPAPRFVEACHRTTAGNPLLLAQLLRALAADGVPPDASHADRVVAVGSRAVASTVLVRLRGLPDDVITVARSSAVLGDGATLPAVASLAGLSEDRAAEGLTGLVRAQVLSDQQPLAFVHPIVRDAIYSALPAVERARWHERAAATLRSLQASDEQVAAHLLLGPPRGDDDVASLLRAAAQSAADRGAPESAATYLRRALVEDPSAPWRADVLRQLGLLEVAFDGSAGAEHLEQAYHLHPDPRVRADIALAAASTHVFASPPGFATSFARRAQALLPDDLDDHRQGLVALQRLSGFLHAVQEGWRTPAPEPQGQGPGAQMVAATIALEALVDGTDRDRAVSMARFSLDGDRLLTVDDGLFWVNAAAVRTLADDPLDDFWTRARALARARGSLFATLSINLWEGFWRWQRGELAEALACLRDALEQDRMWGGTGLGEPLARGFQIGCHLDRGDPVAARRVADALAAEGTFGEGGRIFQQALARLLVTEGRPEEALAALEAAPQGVGIRNPAWNPWRALKAEALHALGRSAEALAVADEQVALLRRWAAPSYLGRGLILRGVLRREDGVEDLREAVRLLAPTPAAVALTRAQCALGGVAGVDDEEAVPLLLEACRTAERRGARGLLVRAQATLERRGHPVEWCVAGSRPISSTEQQILTLAASGLPPEEVARRLFLTPATVLTVLDDLGGDQAAPVGPVAPATSSRSQPAPAMLRGRSDRRPR